MRLQFARVRRGRLRNLLTDCSTVGLHCVTITVTRQEIFKCSLQVTAVGVFPHVISKGVPRLDGLRDKKQVWLLHVRTWGLSEANVLNWKKYLRHYWDFSATHNSTSQYWSGARGIVPPLPPRYALGDRGSQYVLCNCVFFHGCLLF